MDIISHGLYGGIAFGRQSKGAYLTAFFFGVMPDLFSFGIFTLFTILGLASGPDWNAGPPDPASIPSYVHTLYDITHSLVVASVVIGIVAIYRTGLALLMLAWPLHILVDIPTHSSEFFPTPFLWPLSDFHVDGVSWGTPLIFFPNLALLLILYLYFYLHRRAQKNP